MAFENVSGPADWKGDRNAVEWQELEDYDVVRATNRTRVPPRAAEQERKSREQRRKEKKALQGGR